MIRLLGKSTINNFILPYLSSSKRGRGRHPAWEIVEAIFYKLRTGVQWHLLPLKSLLYRPRITWRSVYHHFRKWVLDGSWQRAYEALVRRFKGLLDMSSVQLDGTHTQAKRGGTGVSYQGRKKAATSNTLWLVDASGLSVSFCTPQSGKHHDVYQIQKRLEELVQALARCGISADGLFLNGDAGFDTKEFREACDKHHIIPNVAYNQRNSKEPSEDEYIYFDPELYKQRYTVEQNNAWQDSHRNLLVRHDRCDKSWHAWHYLYAMWQWIKRITLN